MLEKEMRDMIKEFKKTLPMGMRGATTRQMRQTYELADEEGQARMKAALRARLNGEPDPELAEPKVSIAQFNPSPDVLGVTDE